MTKQTSSNALIGLAVGMQVAALTCFGAILTDAITGNQHFTNKQTGWIALTALVAGHASVAPLTAASVIKTQY